MSADPIIERLVDCPEALEDVAGWVNAQWASFSGRTPEQTRERFAAELRAPAADLPRSFVARLGAQPVGLLSLRERDSIDFDPDARPWICNVYVDETARGRGVAGKLVALAMEHAGRLGYRHVYLASERGPDSLYARLGFEVYRVSEAGQSRQYLMRRDSATFCVSQ